MRKNRVFKTKSFSKWMNKTELKDDDLLQAVEEIENGLIDASLGGHILKKRIAMPGAGKRSGTRTIVASQFLNKWFFLFGFEKNEKSNITENELVYLQEVAKRLLHLSDQDIEVLILAGELKELMNHDK